MNESSDKDEDAPRLSDYPTLFAALDVPEYDGSISAHIFYPDELARGDLHKGHNFEYEVEYLIEYRPVAVRRASEFPPKFPAAEESK